MPTSNPLRSYRGPSSLLGRIFYMMSFKQRISGFNDRDFHDNRFDLFRHKMFQGKLWEMAFSTTFLGGSSVDQVANEARRVVHQHLNSTEVMDKEQRLANFKQSSRAYAQFFGTEKKWYQFFNSTANPLKWVEMVVNYLEEALMAGMRSRIREDGRLPGWLMALYLILALTLRGARSVVYSVTGIGHFAKEQPIVFGITGVLTLALMLTCIFFPPAAGFLFSIPALTTFLTNATPWVLFALTTTSLILALMVATMMSQISEGVLNFFHDLKLIFSDEKLFKRSHIVYSLIALTLLTIITLCVFFPPLAGLIFTQAAMTSALAKTGFFLLGVVFAFYLTDKLMALPKTCVNIGRYLLKGPRQWRKDIEKQANSFGNWVSAKFSLSKKPNEDVELAAFAATKKRLETAESAAEFSTPSTSINDEKPGAGKDLIKLTKTTKPSAPADQEDAGDKGAGVGVAEKDEKDGDMNAPVLVNENRQFDRLPVTADGDCGYTAFGITRAQAFALATNRVVEVVNILQPAIQEQLLNEAFITYLREVPNIPNTLLPAFAAYQAAAQQGGEMNLQTIQTLQQHAQELVITNAYLAYDIQEKKIDNGWSHPCMLQALAHLQNIELNLWQLQDDQYIPHAYYPTYRPAAPAARTDLLFINGNHFERLEVRQAPENAGEPLPMQDDTQSDTQDASDVKNNEAMLDVMFESQPLMPQSQTRGRSNTLWFFDNAQGSDTAPTGRQRATTIVGAISGAFSGWVQNATALFASPPPAGVAPPIGITTGDEADKEADKETEIIDSGSSDIVESPSSSSNTGGGSSDTSQQPVEDDDPLNDIHHLFTRPTVRRLNPMLENVFDEGKTRSVSFRGIPGQVADKKKIYDK